MAPLVAALLLAATAIPASAAPPKSFWGLQAWSTPNDTGFQRMGKAKVGTFRVNFLWSIVQPRNNRNRNWRPYDDIMVSATRANIEILPVILGSPKFAARKAQYPPIKSRTAQRAYTTS